MSSCLSGGSRTTFGFDLEIVKKSTSTSSRNSHSSSSPSSTLSESSYALSTRKPRTHRKRPNQTYNEAAVLLASAYPTVFPTNLTKPCSTIHATTAASPLGSIFLDEASELLLPCRVIDHLGFPLRRPLPSYNRIEQPSNSLKNPPPIIHEINPGGDEFETSSIMDEETEAEGIDSIMGVASPESQPASAGITVGRASGISYGLGFTGLMMRRGVTALRQADKGDWWRFPIIDMCHISPRLSSSSSSSSSRSHHKVHSTEQKKLMMKKKKKVIEKKQESEPNISSDTFMEDAHSEPVVPNLTSSLILKLNYEEVQSAWSDRGSPFDEAPEPDISQPNAHAMMLAQIDLFGEGGGVREASVLRYKEKRRTRLFSKKIRYQVRKANADCRPRMKGRFVRRPNCQTMKKI